MKSVHVARRDRASSGDWITIRCQPEVRAPYFVFAPTISREGCDKFPRTGHGTLSSTPLVLICPLNTTLGGCLHFLVEMNSP
jgi:hypothetical protein